MKTKITEGNPEWARFEDWLNDKLGHQSDWTVIAEQKRYNSMDLPFDECCSTLSYLAKYDAEVLDKLFSYDSWDIQYHDGTVYFEEDEEGNIFVENIQHGDAKVFVYRRNEIAQYPSVWKLWPTFENYYNLRRDSDGNLIDPYTDEIVVKISYPADKGGVSVRTDYLRDYLAARNMVLIRQHDYNRIWAEPIDTLPEVEFEDIVHRTGWGCYWLRVSNSQDNRQDRRSRLVAKDIIPPFDKSGTVGGIRPPKIDIDKYPEFIIGKDINGNVKLMKPNPKDILHPAYFHPRVLKRYYDAPSRYSVGFHSPGMGGLSFLDQWQIHLGRNDEGLIIIWLGDLAKAGLSYEEISHWRTHNVEPRGGMAEDFWNAEMGCEAPLTPSLEERLIECKHNIVEAFKSKSKMIYSEYKGPDRYIEKRLRIPLYNEHAEFIEAIMLLSRMFIEYLEDSLFKQELPEQYKFESKDKPFGSIVIFTNWLIHVAGISEETANKLKKALQNIQLVRSKTGAAHRFSDNSYQEVIQKLGLSSSITASELFKVVAEPLADCLEELCKSLDIYNNVWWVKSQSGESR